MTDKKEHSMMGLPRASGKRRWCDDGDDGAESPSKAVCTSPPYALCAEDVLPHSPTPLPASSSSALASTPVAFDECEITPLPEEEVGTSDCEEDTHLSDRPRDDIEDEDDDEEDEENFIDDEEDKDSGFIDGNSIDNSSDDEGDVKVVVAHETSFVSSALPLSHAAAPSLSLPPASETDTIPTKNPLPGDADSPGETELQLSLAKVLSLPPPSTSSACFVSSVGGSTSGPRPLEGKGDPVLTTVTATQTGTTVTSVYPAAVASATYDLGSSFAATDPFSPRPGTPGGAAWSCTFYDGSQPTTNKYMEISPSPGPSGVRTPPASPAPQSIQCDENGKSYLELGSGGPPSYTSPYASDCFTTSPSSYNGASFSQSFSGAAPSYGQPGAYFNPGGSRPNYASPGPTAAPQPTSPGPPPPPAPYGYPASDTYASYDGGDGIVGNCSTYGYTSGGGAPYGLPPPGNGARPTGPGHPPHLLAGSSSSPANGRVVSPQARCSSPICDPTRGGARPPCYPQQRLSVLNVSMVKLNRFSRFPEPSLRRSVLICNTLRHIEREMEAEGVSMAAILAHPYAGGGPPPYGQAAGPPHHCPDTIPSMGSTNLHHHTSLDGAVGPLPSFHPTLISTPPQPPSTPPPSASLYNNDPPNPAYPPAPYSPHEPTLSFEGVLPREGLRPFSPPPERHTAPLLTPTSETPDEDSPVSQRGCEERPEGGINWCSVLSLSSQTDLDTMNNNECQEWNNEDASPTGAVSPHPGGAANAHNALPYPLTASVTDGAGNGAPTNTVTPCATAVAGSPLGPNWKMLPSLSADDVLKSFPDGHHRRHEEDLDSIIKVLVGS